MPAKPRSQIFDPHQVGVYHCWNRLVQRRSLFGRDSLSKRDLSYRKDWLLQRYQDLARAMAIQVLDYAILDNHFHVVLRNRPDLVQAWSDEEVARRWWQVCPLRRNSDGSVPEPLAAEIKLVQAHADEYRSRLSDISWMMRLACQTVARRANREDEVDGRFFAKRFDCKRLKTVADVLACSIYVDLNVIRAGMAETPEASRYTSAYDRIRARWNRVQRQVGSGEEIPCAQDADAWLAPIWLDERAAAYEGVPQAGDCQPGQEKAPRGYNSIGSPRVSNKGFLPLTLDKYLTLLDTLGRVVRQDKRGYIPPELPPILARLQIEAQSWLDRLWELMDVTIKATAQPAWARAG